MDSARELSFEAAECFASALPLALLARGLASALYGVTTARPSSSAAQLAEQERFSAEAEAHCGSCLRCPRSAYRVGILGAAATLTADTPSCRLRDSKWGCREARANSLAAARNSGREAAGTLGYSFGACRSRGGLR